MAEGIEIEIRVNITCFAKFYWVGLKTIYGIELIDYGKVERNNLELECSV